MSQIQAPKVLPQKTTDKLFSILKNVTNEDKEELINDWIVRYGKNNPIFEEAEDERFVDTLLLVYNNTGEHWKNLYLVGDSFGWDTPQHQFTCISDTRWWYIKFTRPKGARLHYMISPNELGTRITNENRMERIKRFRLDERNPECIDEGILEHSVLIYPGFEQTVNKSQHAPDYSNLYLRKKLDGKRSARMATITKSNQNPEKLLIVHDGAAFTKIMEGDKIIRKGVETGRWPGIALMTLDTPFSNRKREYGGRYGYANYFKDIIIPAAEHALSQTFEPKDIILAGSSLGAWAMLDTAMKVPEIADNLLLQSCPMWWPDEDHQKYIREINNMGSPEFGRIYFDCGIYETGREPMSTYESNQHLAQALEKTSQDFMAREFLMGHRYNAWAWALPGALDYIINEKEVYGPLPGREMRY